MSSPHPSSHLRVVTRGDVEPVEARIVVHQGCVTVHCDDDATFDTVTDWIGTRLYVDGQGFARLERDATGAIVRRDGVPVIARYVGFDIGDDEVLLALRDGFEASGVFDTKLVGVAG